MVLDVFFFDEEEFEGRGVNRDAHFAELVADVFDRDHFVEGEAELVHVGGVVEF